MKKFPIALQVYSVRDVAEKEFAKTMREIKEMGYDGVELAGTYGMSAVTIKEILDEIGLYLVSAHVGPDLLEQEEILDDYAATGLKFIVIPWYPGPKNKEELKSSIERIRKIAIACNEKGMQLLYHNHDFEMEEIDGKCILDTYYSEIDEDLLKTELDLCWVRVGGKDPVNYLKKYKGRAPIVHLKDYTGSKTENMYGLIDNGEEEVKTTFEFRPIGYGCQDVPAIVEAADYAESQWLVVEQDQPAMNLSSMECAKMSISYIKSFLK